MNSRANDRARAGTRGGGTSVIPGGVGAQAPRYRGTPRREELTRVPHRTAHTAHQLKPRNVRGTERRRFANIAREPRGRSISSNKRSARRRRREAIGKTDRVLNERSHPPRSPRSRYRGIIDKHIDRRNLAKSRRVRVRDTLSETRTRGRCQ